MTYTAPMTKVSNVYVLFLRGINVGGKNRLPMADLKAILADQGYQQVATYIQSGNAVLASERTLNTGDETRLQQAILARQGFAPEVMLIHSVSWEKALANCPFDLAACEGDRTVGKTLHFYFLAEVPQSPGLDALNALKKPSEVFSCLERCLYLQAPEGIGRSKLAAQVEKHLGVAATARNANTVLAVEALRAKCLSHNES